MKKMIQWMKMKIAEKVSPKVMAGSMTAMAAVMGTGVTAFASESGGSAVSVLDGLIANVPVLFNLIGSVLTSMLKVDVLSFYFTIGLVTAAVGLIWSLRGVSRG